MTKYKHILYIYDKQERTKILRKLDSKYFRDYFKNSNICSFIILSRKLKVNISILTQFLLLANW